MADIAALDQKHVERKKNAAASTGPGDDSMDQLKLIENIYLKKGSNQ